MDLLSEMKFYSYIVVLVTCALSLSLASYKPGVCRCVDYSVKRIEGFSFPSCFLYLDIWLLMSVYNCTSKL